MQLAEPRRLEGIQFGVLTDEQIRRLGVVEVTGPTLHTKGIPKALGPADSRFGTCSRFYRCGTCKNSVLECPGHPGFISLPYPIPHVAFVSYLVRIMNLFCFNCSSFLLPDIVFPDKINAPKKKMAWAYEEARRARARKRTPLMCPNPECGLPQPTVKIEEPFVKLEWYDDVVQAYFGADVTGSVPVTSSSSNAKRKRSTHKNGTEADVMPTEEIPSAPIDQADLDRRRADYEYFVKRPFNNWDAYNVLKSIRKADLAKLSINAEHTHPSGFMLLSLLVPAIGVRPTISFEEGSRRRGYHQLTRKLAEIMKLKRTLLSEANHCRISLDDPDLQEMPESVHHHLQMLYVSISHYLIKDKCKVPNLKMTPYAARAHARSQSVAQSLTGKKGRYRDTLMGKRVDHCMRTVVTPAPDSDIDEIGIPRELAKRLTVPIRVSTHNREQLQKRMAQGDIMQIVDERTGDMIAVTEANRHILPLVDGWVVERYLQEGDIIPINRQPTLHRPSIMGHRVWIHDDRVLKLPPPTTIPYNADHDGDEMNAHVPQTPEARAEVQELLHVPKHLIHPRANKPMMGIIQDGLDAGYFLTQQSALFNRIDAMGLLMTVRYSRLASDTIRLGEPGAEMVCPKLPPPAILFPEERWTGSQLVSQTIPNINMERKVKNRPAPIDSDPLVASDGVLLICNGEILRGSLCKQSLGATAGGIIHMICTYCGNNVAARFMSDVQRMLNKYLTTQGFSIGLDDCRSDSEVQRKVRIVMETTEKHVAYIESLAEEMPNDPQVRQLAEEKTQETLTSMLTMIGNLVRAHLGPSNMFNIMSNIVGSKGSVFNMAQVMGLVGQTFVNGERPSPSGATRILPNAPLPGQEPLPLKRRLWERGFIQRPYKVGLSMPEAFLHNMGGREGLVDTAAKTARTGYSQRRLVKSMESNHVAQDHTIRDAHGSLYQTEFGSDGMDSMRTLRVELSSLMLDDAALRKRCVAESSFEMDNLLHHTALVDGWLRLRNVRDQVRRAKITCMHKNLKQNLNVYLPWNIGDVIVQHRERSGGPVDHLDGDALAASYEHVSALCDTLESEGSVLFAVYHILDELSTGRLRNHWKIGPNDVLAVCQRLLAMHRAGKLQAGEGVGAVTATSIGEPLSQMTLNSVAYDTMVLFWDNGNARVVKMGEFVDTEVEQAETENRPGIERQVNGTIWVPLTRPVYIPSPDAHGVVKWDVIEAVTRHPVINKDGSSDLVRLTTEGGRVVDVTMGESVLKWDFDTETLVTARADELTDQDLVPVTVRMPEPPVVKTHLDLRAHFCPTKHVHTTTMHSLWQRYQDGGISFPACVLEETGVIPFNREDSALCALKHQPTLCEPGHIYLKQRRENSVPEQLPLDYETGFAFGAYCAEGCHSITQAVWSNIDPHFNKRVTDWLDRTGVSWHTASRKVNNGTSTSTWAHSTMLAHLMPKLCGSLSHNKKVPDFMFSASNECISGFMDGYFSGDGCFTRENSIAASSRSKTLLEGVANLLMRFEIYSKISQGTWVWKGVPRDGYELRIQQGNINIFARLFTMTIPYKQDRIEYFKSKVFRHRHLNKDPLEHKDVVLEAITGLERVEYARPYAYDLTVARTRNMQLFNGLSTFDTFHSAGTLNAGMTHGVPRVKEIIGASKNIATPVMTVPLKPGLVNPKAAAEMLARSLPYTLLKNIVTDTRTVYEPDLTTSHLATDAQLVQRHAPFVRWILDRACPWVIRFQLCKIRAGTRSLEPRGIADLIQDNLQDSALVIASQVNDPVWSIRVYLLDTDAAVDASLKKSVQTGTTRTAAKRASQRQSMSARKRKRYADLTSVGLGDAETLAVPLHKVDPAVGRTRHTPRDVIEWMIVRNIQNELFLGLRVCGLVNVTAAAVRVTDHTVIDPVTGAVSVQEEYVVDVRGHNLTEVATLPMVDFSRLVSNHVMMVYETLGITAAAHALFYEFCACLSASGSRVDERLVQLVVDVMTHNGFVMPISRHGLNRLINQGVLAKITFEETLEMLIEAAAFGYFDKLMGVSENTMLGRQPSLGTNLSQMYIDRDGERVSCTADAGLSNGSAPDTRILCSVVTEYQDELDDVEQDDMALRDEALGRVLTVHNVHSEHVESAHTDTNTSKSQQELYHQHFYYQPNGEDGGVVHSGDLPPVLDDNVGVPFRPSSPTFEVGDDGVCGMNEPFRPSSPTFD